MFVSKFQFYLYVLGDAASAAVRSGAADLDRGLSSGVQAWETDETQARKLANS